MPTAERDRIHLISNLVFARKLLDSRASGKGIADPAALLDIVREFERDGFDALFVSDFLGLNRQKITQNPVLSWEPVTFLAAAAAVTERIGLVGTGSTMFEYPYNLARQFASLDHLSRGRAGWNAVTSFSGERNFGLDKIPPPEERYEIATEFIDVAKALWRSWGQDAVITDPADPRHVDTDAITDIAHRGRHFAVEEALDIPPSPQGRPVIFQAGSSEEGIAFAGRTADAVFVAVPSFEHAREFFVAVKAAARNNGRDPNALKVLPGLHVFIGETEEEARQKYRVEIDPATIERIKAKLTHEFPELDLSGLGLDQPIPPDRIPDLDSVAGAGRRRSRISLIVDIATRPGTTLADFIEYIARSYGHLVFVGTADGIADEIERWFRKEAADGFVLLGNVDSYDLFVRQVLPRLQARGIWSPPTAATLRENLGIGDLVD